MRLYKLYQPLPSSWSERRLLLPCILLSGSSADGSRQPQIKHVDDACGHVGYNDVGLKEEWSAPRRWALSQTNIIINMVGYTHPSLLFLRHTSATRRPFPHPSCPLRHSNLSRRPACLARHTSTPVPHAQTTTTCLPTRTRPSSLAPINRKKLISWQNSRLPSRQPLLLFPESRSGIQESF